MAIADRSGLPVAIGIASASPHEVTLVEETIDNGFLAAAPERLIGDRAYDSDGLDKLLRGKRGLLGGGSGIRTHGTFRYTRFPSVRPKPARPFWGWGELSTKCHDMPPSGEHVSS